MPLRVVPSLTGLPSKRCPGHGQGPGELLSSPGPGEVLCPRTRGPLQPPAAPLGRLSCPTPTSHGPRARPCSSPGLRLPRWSLRPQEPCTQRPKRAVRPLPQHGASSHQERTETKFTPGPVHCRERRPSAREDGGVTGVSSSCGARGGFQLQRRQKGEEAGSLL